MAVTKAIVGHGVTNKDPETGVIQQKVEKMIMAGSDVIRLLIVTKVGNAPMSAIPQITQDR